MKIYFCRHGRFGNNIFQYIVAKILCNEYGYELVNERRELISPLVFDDSMWKKWSETKSLPAHKDIFLNGFFQQMHILLPYRDYIRSLFHIENRDFINDSVKVCDVVDAYNKTETPLDNEIVMHIRMGDFKHDNYNSHILNPNFYISILDKIGHTGGLTIVCDKLETREEEEYMRWFDRYNPRHRSKTMLEDFVYIMKAKRLLSSNSTFAFIASFLGSPVEVYIPWTNFYKEQTLCRFGQKCTIIPALCIDIYSGTVKSYM